MNGVRECGVEQNPNVSICEPVVRHASGSADLHDAVRTKQPQGVRRGRFAQVRQPRELADAGLPRAQHGQQPKPSGIGQQREHVGDIRDVAVGRQQYGAVGVHDVARNT